MSSNQPLPYQPARLIRSSTSIYIFESAASITQSPQLRSIDLTSSIDSSNLDSRVVNAALPFWTNDTAYTIIPHADGNITAVGGLCKDGVTSLWSFRPDEKGNGSWTQGTVSSSGTSSTNGYLSEGLAYTTKANSSSASIVLFGGMCPDATVQTQSWTAGATYSDSLTQFDHGSGAEYDATAISISGSPIAEAGMSITSLPPTAASGSDSRQQNFVFLGGHTQSAFINMSQVAILSTPHAAWTFLPVQQAQDGKSDLTRRSAVTTVEPRSGHTAILSDDGTKIMVLGGWVGDINTPAEPQLAILEVGAGYGGSGSWQWTTPSLSGLGIASGSGIYGHGAVMLPGSIMMVHGGYSISSTSSRLRRATSSQTLLFNITSNSWISTYSAPAGGQAAGTVQASSSTSDSLGQKIGLAVGLTLGFLILLGLLAFYFWYNRRLKRRAVAAGRALESRSSDGSVAIISQPFIEKHSIDGRGGDMAALNHYWMNAGRPDVQPMAQSSAATGLFVDIPSPTRGLRKSNAARNYQYHAAPRYDDKRISRGSGSIHPIAELDGEDLIDHEDDTLMSEAHKQLQEVERILQSNRKASASATAPDPLRSHPVSPEALTRNVDETSPTISRQASQKRRAETFADASGRLSPTKTDDRTSSTLSEASQRSVLSNGSITRTMSTRTGRLLAAAAAAHMRGKTVEVEASSSSDGRTSTMSTDDGRRTPHVLGRSSTNASSGGQSAAADSFQTARSALPREDDALLYAADYDDPYRRALAADSRAQSANLATRRRPGILGSLRRAIGAIATDRTGSLTSTKAGAEVPSTLSSPVKERRAVDGFPRRTASDGSALLRQKRGKQDWTDHQWAPYTDDPDPGDWGQPYRTSVEKRDAEEDWDVEDAVTKRDVQVMFTIPKSRLRVVNADADRASLRSVSDGALSRAGSVRGLSRKGSRTLLDIMSEGSVRE